MVVIWLPANKKKACCTRLYSIAKLLSAKEIYIIKVTLLGKNLGKNSLNWNGNQLDELGEAIAHTQAIENGNMEQSGGWRETKEDNRGFEIRPHPPRVWCYPGWWSSAETVWNIADKNGVYITFDPGSIKGFSGQHIVHEKRTCW
jgi:hypothetical protein